VPQLPQDAVQVFRESALIVRSRASQQLASCCLCYKEQPAQRFSNVDTTQERELGSFACQRRSRNLSRVAPRCLPFGSDRKDLPPRTRPQVGDPPNDAVWYVPKRLCAPTRRVSPPGLFLMRHRLHQRRNSKAANNAVSGPTIK
jgi:hypothetical protein